MAEEDVKRRSIGSMTLEELTEACGTVQNLSGCKLKSISKKTDEPKGKFNLALFKRVGLDDENIPKPVLIKAGTDEDNKKAIEAQEESGKKLIFKANIFVENAETDILGFV
jgi:predicted transcriptional regulator